MASLTGQSISTSYQGLIKTTDNAAIGATEKRITDGVGNNTTITVGTGGVSFDSGTVDFTGSTVTGLPTSGVTSIIAGTGISIDQATGDVTVSSSVTDTTYTLDTAQSGSDATITLTGSDASTDSITLAAGTNITLTEAGDTITIAASGGGAAGLVAGTGTDSMKNADALVTNAASAAATRSIVLGDGAQVAAQSTDAIAIGTNANCEHLESVAIGKGALAHYKSTALGVNSDAGGTDNKGGTIAIGNAATANGGDDSIAMGTLANADANKAISIGASSDATANYSLAIGNNTPSAVDL